MYDNSLLLFEFNLILGVRPTFVEVMNYFNATVKCYHKYAVVEIDLSTNVVLKHVFSFDYKESNA